MSLIGTLTDFQQGMYWGEFVEVFLLGIYTCLVVVTLREGIWEGRPLKHIGWFVVVVYWLAVWRLVLGLWILYRVMFVNGGNTAEYDATDYVLHGVRQGLSLASSHLADTVFIWRLYVLWSRNILVALLPGLLFLCSTSGATVVVITDFLLAKDPRYLAINSLAFDTTLVAILVNSCYVTILVSGRLWWVGRMMDRVNPMELSRRTRYQGAIAAFLQSGAMYTIAIILSLATSATKNIILYTVMGSIGAFTIGISATLLILQLNLFQDAMREHKINGPTLTTGPTFHFAHQQLTHRVDDAEPERISLPLTQRRRRASIAAYYLRPHDHDTDKDVSFLPRPSPPRISSRNRFRSNISGLGSMPMHKSLPQDKKTAVIPMG
ncbi:hypothetical protein FRB98_001928 [Tulasnella sp. 332]|nr:hypothetical protein FRB98_001928 [Tulasnella sp. 332]